MPNLLGFPICRLRIDEARSANALGPREDTGDIGGESVGVEQWGNTELKLETNRKILWRSANLLRADSEHRRTTRGDSSESTHGDSSARCGAVQECGRRSRFYGGTGRHPYTAQYGSETDEASTRTHRVRTHICRLSHTNLYGTQNKDSRNIETYVDHDVEPSRRDECTDSQSSHVTSHVYTSCNAKMYFIM
ncbi:hypothetical protein L2E82_08866 [Cichorium intybus]|uniref:Uncharacterized protein n=1 Tax=Cichorium intybus TaxID=13427 RepID=A0ACB9G741_CICIN|nr:hypothetical protein L2E82_08866 [Cichorium intybus]